MTAPALPSAALPSDLAARFGSGQAVRRVEDPALVTGRGRYTADLLPADALHVAFVRSSVAHGVLRELNLSGAREAEGVVAVFSGADLVTAGVKPQALAAAFRRPDGTPMQSAPRRALAHEVVRYVGEPVAMIVATSRTAARAAADVVFVDVEEQPAVVDPLAALEPGAPRVGVADDNVCAEMRHGDAAASDAAFAAAAHRVRLPIVNQRLAPASMEPRTVLAAPGQGDDVGRWIVTLSSQMPSAVRDGLVAALPGLTKADVRVRVFDVGGGFGMKTGLYPEDIAVLFAARALNRPVAWRPDRLEEFLSAIHGRDVQGHAELALSADGRATALRVRGIANVGAYPSTASAAIQLLIGPWVSTSVYDIPVVDLHYTAVLTHTAATGAYRGAGRPEAIYLIERLMDAAARQMDLDRAELRRRNLVAPAQMPYTNAMRQTYDSGNFPGLLEQALARAGWGDEAAWAQRQAAARARGAFRGRALSTFLEWTSGNSFEERVTVDVKADGFIEIFTATMAMGQGIVTSYVQLAVDAFGVPPERIRIVQGDTDRGNGFGSAGSRSLFTAGSALQVAAQRTLEVARERAGQALEVAPADLQYAGGRFTVAGTDLGIELAEVAAREPEQHLFLESSTTVGGPSWPNGAHVAEVEVDEGTGEVRLCRYLSFNDIGRVVSPPIVKGQIEGGAVQGIGQALCEQVRYDEGGQLQTGSFMDYALPRVDLVAGLPPEAGGFEGFDTHFDTSVPCRTNPLGAKGVGELGTIGATPTVVNAVLDALAGAGVPVAMLNTLQMPLTAERVWAALQCRAGA
ncbi:MAG: xanthine dehydrogenase family protein molybdopterin-binding subunit [Rubrivivax sp.]